MCERKLSLFLPTAVSTQDQCLFLLAFERHCTQTCVSPSLWALELSLDMIEARERGNLEWDLELGVR